MGPFPETLPGNRPPPFTGNRLAGRPQGQRSELRWCCRESRWQHIALLGPVPRETLIPDRSKPSGATKGQVRVTAISSNRRRHRILHRSQFRVTLEMCCCPLSDSPMSGVRDKAPESFMPLHQVSCRLLAQSGRGGDGSNDLRFRLVWEFRGTLGQHPGASRPRRSILRLIRTILGPGGPAGGGLIHEVVSGDASAL